MLVELAIGDAYGAGFEFASDEFVAEHNTLKRYLPHPKDGSVLPAGSYTDDTQMSIAIAERILAGGPYTAETFADDFVATFNRDKRQGYSENFFNLLLTCETGSDLISKIKPRSIRNGAMMRSVPLGLLSDAAMVVRVAHTQAAITHDTFEAKQSSAAVGLMAHLIIQGENPSRIADIIHKDINYILHGKWESRVACDAYQTTQAVWTCLLRHNTMSALLQDAVSFGGDTDSIAAVALGLASLSQSYYNDLPEFLYADLEAGWPEKRTYGLSFLQRLDANLVMSGAPRE